MVRKSELALLCVVLMLCYCRTCMVEKGVLLARNIYSRNATREVGREVTSRANARASEAGDQVWKENYDCAPL